MTPAQKDERPEARGYGQGYEYFGMALNFTVVGFSTETMS